MKRFLLFFFLLVLSLSTKAEKPEYSTKVEKELSKFFEVDQISTIEIAELSNQDDVYLKLYSDVKELGLVVLTSAKGRYDRFDYMIVYNLNYEIKLIKILVYRSEYGSEITAKRWLRQFYNKQDDSLRYGSDIQAISGATFSASSLTINVNRINKIIKEYLNN